METIDSESDYGSDDDSSHESSSLTHSSSRRQNKKVADEVKKSQLADDGTVIYVATTGPKQPGTETSFTVDSTTPSLLATVQVIFEGLKQRSNQLCYKYFSDHQYWIVAVLDFTMTCVFQVFIINTKDPRTAILNPIENTEVTYKVESKFLLGDFDSFLQLSKYIRISLCRQKGIAMSEFDIEGSVMSLHQFQAGSTSSLGLSEVEMVQLFASFYSHHFCTLRNLIDDAEKDIALHHMLATNKPYTIDYNVQNQITKSIQQMYSSSRVEQVRETFRRWGTLALLLKLFNVQFISYTENDVDELAGSKATESFKKYFVRPPEHPLLHIYAFQFVYLLATTPSFPILASSPTLPANNDVSAGISTVYDLSAASSPNLLPSSNSPPSMQKSPSSMSPAHSPTPSQHYDKATLLQCSDNSGFMKYVSTVLSHEESYPYPLIVDRMKEMKTAIAREEDIRRIDSAPTSPSKGVQRRRPSAVNSSK